MALVEPHAPVPSPAAVAPVFLAPRDVPRLAPDLLAASQKPNLDDGEAVLREWKPVTARLALTDEAVRAIADRAVVNRTGFLVELVVSGLVPEAEIFRAIADELGLPFLPQIEPAQLMVRERDRRAALSSRHGLPLVLIKAAGGGHAHVLARTNVGLRDMRARIARLPGLAARLFIAPPSVLRAAILHDMRGALLADAQHALFVSRPELSARHVANGWQGVCVGLFVGLLPVALVLAPLATMMAIHTFAAAAFFACVALRGAALNEARPPQLRRQAAADPAEQPVYSVLVALYRERDVIPQLLVALGRLQWPRSKLEIKLVCEADDEETLAALRAQRLRPGIEIVEVPPSMPRTKPKALAYALPLCSGDFVTLYDAEDRPHPLQLVEAWQRFRREGGDLACLQAPLIVTNSKASWLSRMFAFEYAGLFRGLLPMLARLDLMVPLGGTSNHFRRAALLEVGGWDPYNVTEDADLALRLRRFGYRTGVMNHPTFEDGPETLKEWLPQRIRWFKGWIQTWLVHMRDPVALWRELGVGSFLVTQILFAGMLASALVHPFFAASTLYGAVMVASTGALASAEALMAAVGIVSIAVGYAVFIALGWTTLSAVEKLSLGKIVLLTPLHWLLLSLAAWLAVWEVYRRPHHWHKTPHRRARSFGRRAVSPEDASQRSADEGSPMICGSSSPIASMSRPS